MTLLLADAPDDVRARTLLAHACVALDRFDDATGHISHAIRVAPDDPTTWYAAAHVFLARHRLDRAEQAISECIRLEPRNPDAHALAGSIEAQRKNWSAALAAADEGLRLNPAHENCVNIRALALTRLGREGEAARTLRGQLSRTPENALTHANQGWTDLHRGEYDQALEHFREALRLEPGHEWARLGIIEALKARHWLYRPVLRYFLWMESLQPRVQFAILIGGWLLYQGARKLADGDSPLRPLFLVFMAAYLTFALSTWFAAPLANGLLCLNRFGRMALKPWEKTGAAVVCSLLAVGVLSFFEVFGAAFVTPGVFIGLLALPLKVMFDLDERRARAALAAYTVVLAGLSAFIIMKERDTKAEALALRPRVEAAVAMDEERLKFQTRLQEATERPGESDLPAIRREIDSFKTRYELLEAELLEDQVKERSVALRESQSTLGNLAVVLSLLAFFGSQFLGGLVAEWAARK